MVEAAGIEPASRCPLVKASTCLVYLLLPRPPAAPARQGSRSASPIVSRPVSSGKEARASLLVVVPKAPQAGPKGRATSLGSHCHVIIGTCVCARCLMRPPDNLSMLPLTSVARSNPFAPQIYYSRTRATIRLRRIAPTNIIYQNHRRCLPLHGPLNLTRRLTLADGLPLVVKLPTPGHGDFHLDNSAFIKIQRKRHQCTALLAYLADDLRYLNLFEQELARALRLVAPQMGLFIRPYVEAVEIEIIVPNP